MSKLEILDLGRQGLSNKFITKKEKNLYENGQEQEYSFPLKVQFDTENYLVSLVQQPPAELMFNEDYPYHTGSSQTMRQHFKTAADLIKTWYEPEKILEIGSNDGTFIKNFLTTQATAVEPCKNFSDKLNDEGYKSYPLFWTMDNAKTVKEERGQFDLIYAANCACHVPSIDEFFNACFIALREGGVLILEDPSLLATIENCAYSQFYDEHHYLFSSLALEKIGYNHGLRLTEVHPMKLIHMGSERRIFEKGDYNLPEDTQPAALRDEERYGLDRPEVYFKFAEQVRGNIEIFYEYLRNNRNKKIVAFGATSKANTIYSYLNHHILNGMEHIYRDEYNTVEKYISCVTDTTPEKIGKFTPLSHIPIIEEPEDLNEIADIVFLGAPNYQSEILKKHSNFIGTWFTTIPFVHEVR